MPEIRKKSDTTSQSDGKISFDEYSFVTGGSMLRFFLLAMTLQDAELMSMAPPEPCWQEEFSFAADKLAEMAFEEVLFG